MADISPFLSTPQQWVEELGRLRYDRSKIEAREEKLRDKIRAHFEASKIDRLAAGDFEARLEARHSTDLSQKTLAEVMGEKKFAALKAKLPTSTSEFLVVRELTEKPNNKRGENADLPEIRKAFGGGAK